MQNQIPLSRGPTSQVLPIRCNTFGLLDGEVFLFIRIGRKIKQFGAAAFQFVNKFPAAVAQSQKSERIIGVKQSCPRRRIEQGGALVLLWNRQAEQIENRRRGVHETRGAFRADWFADEARSDDEIGHMDVLLVDEQGVAEVAFVLAKRLAVVAENEEQRLVKQAARLQTTEKPLQNSVTVVQGVSIAANFIVSWKRSRHGGVVGMMPGHRQVSDEKVFAALNRINPIQHPFRRRLVIHAEARFVIAAN